MLDHLPMKEAERREEMEKDKQLQDEAQEIKERVSVEKRKAGTVAVEETRKKRATDRDAKARLARENMAVKRRTTHGKKLDSTEVREGQDAAKDGDAGGESTRADTAVVAHASVGAVVLTEEERVTINGANEEKHQIAEQPTHAVQT